jgi:two-component system, OmpR family, sensor histidine kinase KdpD
MMNAHNGNRIGPADARRFFLPGYRIHPMDFLLTLGAVALTTAVLSLARSQLSTQVIALLYLLPVMLSATRWGLLPALAASLVSFFAFNFFFLTPTYTLAVSDPEELLALMVFLIVAVLLSQSVAAANMHAAQAEFREKEATTLYTLTRALEAQSDWKETLASISRIITEAFNLSGCEILASPEKEPPASGDLAFSVSSGDISSEHLPEGNYKFGGPQGRPPESVAGTGAAEVSDEGLREVDIPLAARQAPVGTLRLFLRPSEAPPGPTTMRLLTTFAAQVGLFIERARLAREAGRAQLLEESDRLKSALLSSVSHDLRTPLSAIKASATVLLKEDQALDPTTRQDLLSAINEETDRLNHLVGDLLDMSRIEAGALRLKRDWCDMDELIRAVARRHGVRAQFHWAPDLPFVLADYVQIDRVMSNLLENAIRFAPSQSSIDIEVRTDEREMTVSVTNPGPAIPRRLHPHLFDKFYRISEERSPGMGTGLGLSICKGIVEAHGGRIWVESPVTGDSGTRFVFTLPMVDSSADDGEQDDEEDENSHRG